MSLSKYSTKVWRAGCIMALLALQACAIANPRGANYLPDETTTSALAPADASQKDEHLNNDGKIIRDFVVGASLTDLASVQGLAWNNEDTHSRGVISAIWPVEKGSRNCRAFKTTRESFDGVMVYEGEACQDAGGRWILSRLEAQ